MITAAATSSRSFRIGRQHSPGIRRRPGEPSHQRGQAAEHLRWNQTIHQIDTPRSPAFGDDEPPWRRPSDRRPRHRATTLLNRELSWLDLNQRVLDLAADPAEPLLERVKFCAIFSSNLDEFFMVRVAGLLDQVVARRQRPLARRAHAPAGARRGARARARADRGAVEALARRARARRSPREGIVVGTVEDATEEELARARDALRAPDLPGADPARGRARAAVPVHLGALALASGSPSATPTRARSASRASRCPETLPRFVAIGDARAADPARGRDLALPELALPRAWS